ncbi:hypothetical protein [Cytobacillus praedii]|uniref:hypothetical protein n=1 Tax=Cytobacillus praedii TaxID=1742358 RepID=UPI002E20EF53|nr:hypothetical protein [Cytobacillus praedii]
MTSGQLVFLEQSSNPSSPAQMSEGLILGVRNAFMYGFVRACISFILVMFVKRTQAHKE